MKQSELLRRAVDAEPVPRDLEARVRTKLTHRPGVLWGRLLTSFVMLVMVVGGAQYYTEQKVRALYRVGVADHVHCAIEGAYPHQTERSSMMVDLGPYAPMLQPILDQSPGDTVESAHRCTVSGRDYVHVILRRGRTLISVILTKRTGAEGFPGKRLREGKMDGYSVSGFEAGAYLGYVVSALPGQQNSELAGRVVTVVRRYTGV